jgi:hypothetical protein
MRFKLVKRYGIYKSHNIYSKNVPKINQDVSCANKTIFKAHDKIP